MEGFDHFPRTPVSLVVTTAQLRTLNRFHTDSLLSLQILTSEVPEFMAFEIIQTVPWSTATHASIANGQHFLIREPPPPMPDPAKSNLRADALQFFPGRRKHILSQRAYSQPQWASVERPNYQTTLGDHSAVIEATANFSRETFRSATNMGQSGVEYPSQHQHYDCCQRFLEQQQVLQELFLQVRQLIMFLTPTAPPMKIVEHLNGQISPPILLDRVQTVKAARPHRKSKQK